MDVGLRVDDSRKILGEDAETNSSSMLFWCGGVVEMILRPRAARFWSSGAKERW